MKGKTTIWLFLAMGMLAAALLFGSSETDSATQTEKRMAEVLSAIDGAGRVEVALFYTSAENDLFSAAATAARPTGAVVVAQGAADMQVRLQLIRAVRTLLGLGENAVDVFVMEEGRR